MCPGLSCLASRLSWFLKGEQLHLAGWLEGQGLHSPVCHSFKKQRTAAGIELVGAGHLGKACLRLTATSTFLPPELWPKAMPGGTGAYLASALTLNAMLKTKEDRTRSAAGGVEADFCLQCWRLPAAGASSCLATLTPGIGATTQTISWTPPPTQRSGARPCCRSALACPKCDV